MIPVFISTSTFGLYDAAVLERLKSARCQVEVNTLGRKLQPNETIEFLNKSQSIGLIAGIEELNDEVLRHVPSLKVISRCGGGLDTVDLDYCKRNNILVFNTPDAPTNAVAELTVGLMLTALRKIALADHNIRLGKWKPLMGSLLQNKVVGIIGFGRIGKRLAQLLTSFECKILFYDPYVEGGGVLGKKVELPELLKEADIVSIHASPEKHVRPFIGKEELLLVKKDALIVNVARGNAVDEKELLNALQERRIACAALDVFEQEPYKGLFTQREDVVLTSHMGSYAKESRILQEWQSIENLLSGLKTLGILGL